MRGLAGALFVAAMLLAGCTGAPVVTPSASSATTPSQLVVSPSPATPEPSVAGAPSGSPSRYTSTQFEPSFTVDLPAGWIVAERGSDVAQIYQECSTCAHGGEENGEISLDMTYADRSLDEAIADLLKADNAAPSGVEKIKLGTVSAAKFTATRTGKGEPSFRATGYHSEAAGLPIDVYAVTVAGKTVTVFIDAHEATSSAGAAFMDTARQILEDLLQGR
jgi:hypothetical protein